MSELRDLLAVAPARPIFSTEVTERGHAPRVNVPSLQPDPVEHYALFHGLIGLELAAKSFRAFRPRAGRRAFTRFLTDFMGR